MIWKGSGIYEGIFVNGKRSGYGRMIFWNGSYFEGTFKDNLYDGFGKQVIKTASNAVKPKDRVVSTKSC